MWVGVACRQRYLGEDDYCSNVMGYGIAEESDKKRAMAALATEFGQTLEFRFAKPTNVKCGAVQGGEHRGPARCGPRLFGGQRGGFLVKGTI